MLTVISGILVTPLLLLQKLNLTPKRRKAQFITLIMPEVLRFSL